MAESLKRAPKLRCAIYTRKSSEEGLEQEFNSLQAQREACEAFIASQRNEGWQALPALYDDGGWSGGTLDRPALQRLLADIRASKVDVVVVYKIEGFFRQGGTMLRRRNASSCYVILRAGAQSTFGMERDRAAMATLTRSFSPSLRTCVKAGTITMATMRTPLTP